MSPVILHIYGPFSIHAYGIAIACGLFLFLHQLVHNPTRAKIIDEDHLTWLFMINIIVGLLGARILHIINSHDSYESWYDIFALWNGGLSVLGVLIALTIVNPLYFLYYKIPVFRMMDLGALYAPLVHGFGRIGCFFAGCCYGKATDLPWAVMYTHRLSHAPLNLFIHPTQLYTAILDFTLLFILHYIARHNPQPGTIFMLYLIGISSTRFFIDFLRDDRTLLNHAALVSQEQWLALAIIVFGFCSLIMIHFLSRRTQL